MQTESERDGQGVEMTDPNRASVPSVGELRKLREATYEGEWYANFFRSPRGARSYWCVGVKGRGSQQVARAINSEREAEFIAYAANHALTLIERLSAYSQVAGELELIESGNNAALEYYRQLRKRTAEVSQLEAERKELIRVATIYLEASTGQGSFTLDEYRWAQETLSRLKGGE